VLRVLPVLLAAGLLAPTPVHGGVEELIQAARDGDTGAVASLAATGADLDERHPTDGVTALFVASLHGKAAVVAELLKAGANADALTSANKSSLGAAAHNGHTGVLQLLLDAGAEVDLPGVAGETALCAAARSGAAASITLLAAAGANVRLKGDNGQTALHLAASAGHAEAAEALLDGGAFVNAVDAGEYTPLHMAAGFGESTALSPLPLILSYKSEKSLCGAGHDAVVHALVKAGAEVTLRSQTGLTALHLAAATNGGSKTSVEALLASGADLNQRCGQCSTSQLQLVVASLACAASHHLSIDCAQG
jgi:ankyrin repeat protein